MKRVWVCQWEAAPELKLHTEKFFSFSEAVKAMRQIITEKINLDEYISDLEPNEANYLRNYLKDPGFPYSDKDVPEDFELPEYGDLSLYGSMIRWDYPYDAHPFLSTNLVMNPDGDEQCFFDFWYNYPEEATGHGATGLNIRIIPCMDFGNSAHPLMVWNALQESAQTQGELIRRIRVTMGTAIDRKAVGRHLQLLQDLGFPVRKCDNGYCRAGEFREPRTDVQYGTSAYPLMILNVLDQTPKTQVEIIRAVQEKYGVKIDRKAVKRHLDLLEAMPFRLMKCKEGFYCQ